MKTCSKCGRSVSAGNFFKDGPLCGRCWREETPDWWPQISRELRRIGDLERQRVKRERRSESERIKDLKYLRQWHEDNPEKTGEYSRRRQSLKAGLPNTFSAEDKRRALDYFHGCCAICGRPLNDLFGDHAQSMDHWIAMTDPRPDNPGTVATNMLPLCFGKGACNNSKNNADPIVWVNRQFSKHEAREILGRIETYFEWVACQPSGKVAV